ncbi:hypothetical protein EZV62_012153 [Acer yangbiense]|uniref:Peptidase A2 domain-containing protein n=1 Tax=Acer yangbiense TaxID=1000413 RepID=A0A5C7HV42_9ROSI|nr:hypothetical protein EZV62_012153 [Acer yangbiense]
MSDKDSLFFFMDGLKDWARVELERRNVHDKSGGDESKDQDRKDKGHPKSPNGDNWHNKPQGGKTEVVKPKSPCFICNRPHWVHDYPKRKMLNAMVTQLKETKATEAQASMGFIQQIYALNGRVVPPMFAERGLMFVGITIKGKQVRALLDTGAMHNFISVDEAKQLGLRVTNEGGAIKAANSPIKPIDGTAKGVTVHLGPWS